MHPCTFAPLVTSTIINRTLSRLKRPRLLLPTALLLGLALWPLLPSPASPEALQAAEARLLSVVQRPVQQRMVPSGEHRLNTVIVGDGEKPPLVLMHGHGGGVGVFTQNFDALAEMYTVYAVDLLGWGRSDRPPFTGRTAESAQAWWVDSLEAWRQALGLERITLLGHSMGGFVATSYALAHSDHLDHLILVDAAGMSAPVQWQSGPYFNLTPQRVVRWGVTLVQRCVAASCQEESARTPYPEGALVDYYYQISAAPPSGEDAFRKILGMRAWALPQLPRLAELTVPTTLIWGADDELVSPRNGERAHALLPTSELYLVPAAGHSPYSEQPDAFHALLRNSPFRVHNPAPTAD